MLNCNCITARKFKTVKYKKILQNYVAQSLMSFSISQNLALELSRQCTLLKFEETSIHNQFNSHHESFINQIQLLYHIFLCEDYEQDMIVQLQKFGKHIYFYPIFVLFCFPFRSFWNKFYWGQMLEMLTHLKTIIGRCIFWIFVYLLQKVSPARASFCIWFYAGDQIFNLVTTPPNK